MAKRDQSTGTPSRVLVVDDDPAIRWILEGVLDDAGFDVLLSPDGRVEGIDLATVDVIITDLFMPVCDGLKLLTRLRKEAPHVRTIAITGAPTFHGLEMLEVAGGLDADVTIAKPFPLQRIVSACREFAQAREATPAR